ncbi:MAG: nucleotide exchange factor GrpE [Candidatus Bathyarchaeota archaeon]|nr:nucleotide exchange factor GrpE [Candidatus Bathyarchaeota archaeon]
MKDNLKEGKAHADFEAQLVEEKKRSEEYLNCIKYLQADCENMTRRFDRQLEQAVKCANERLVMQLLEVIDELEMAVKNAQDSGSAQLLVEGVQMTLKKLRKVLEQEGVFPIECEGQPFDPSKHNAVATVERPDVEGCIVVEDIRKGYALKDKIIRPSIVKVSVNPSSQSKTKEENET